MNAMRKQFLLLALITIGGFHGTPLAHGNPSIKSSEVPKLPEETINSFVERLENYWTDDKINAATPMPLMEYDPTKMIEDTNMQDNGQKPIVFSGTNPIYSTSRIASKRAGFPNTVGKVYFVDGFSTYSCSASVVTADNKDLIVTAGHCVYSTTTNAFVRNFIFIPQYDNNTVPTRPYGTWAARYLYAMYNWATYADLNSDVAFVLLYTLSNRHIQDVVGSQGIQFYSSHSGYVHSFGYPSNYNNAQIMTYCNGTKSFSNYGSYTGDAIPCGMGQGCSGGPWFESFSFSSLSGTQTSVNSFIRATVPNVMYGPYFGSSVQSLYNTARGNTGASSISRVILSETLFLFCLVLLSNWACVS